MPNAQCPMPNAPCPMPHAQSLLTIPEMRYTQMRGEPIMVRHKTSWKISLSQEVG
ncbi:MAG: hypothetical protein ACRAVC_17250 [Trichormus sp.]